MKIKIKFFLICFLFSSVNVFAQWTEQMYNYYSFENYTNYKQFNDAIEPTTFDANLLEAAIFYETNRQRVKNGIQILHYDYALNVAAHNHSVDMVKYNFYSHTSVVTGKIKLVDRINQVGYYNMMCGENIAYSPIKESYAKTAQYLVADLWMNSQGHKENILNKGYTHLGCGIAVYYQDSWVYVKATQNFLRK